MNWDYKGEDVDIHSPESLFKQALENPAIVDLSSEDALALGYQLTLFNDEKIDVKVTIADDDFDDFDFSMHIVSTMTAPSCSFIKI